MSSAAIIGRQLRQQQSSSRISGPVVPPTQYKGRAVTPSPVPQQQQQHPHQSHPHPAQSQDSICSSASVPYCRASLVASLATESSSPPEFLAPPSAYLTPALFATLNQSNQHRPQHLGADVDKKFAQFSRLYSHEFYPHPAHRENAQEKAAAAAKEKKQNEPRLRCTRHCFCIAFKALSSGILLLVVGAIMSVIGFYVDSMAAEEMRQQNNNSISNTGSSRDSVAGNNEASGETNSSTSGVDGKSSYHNLTYLGPLIMGLGAIVLLAACVLTFEVRDTLGVKEPPPPPPVEETTATKKREREDVISPKYDDSNNNRGSVIDDHSANLLSSYLSQTLRADKVKPRMPEESSEVIPTTKQSYDHKDSKHYHRHHHRHRHRHRKQQPPPSPSPPQQSRQNSVIGQQESITVLDHQILYGQMLEGEEDITPTGYNPRLIQHSNVSTPSTLVNMPPGHGTTPTGVEAKRNHLRPHEGSCSSIDHSYLRIPSPQDLELSDPEGCSLMSRYYRQARCSCTGSPTNSNTIALAIETVEQGSSHSYNNHKMLASIESDGLSSATSSEFESGCKLLKDDHHHTSRQHPRARGHDPTMMGNNSISQLTISMAKSDQLLSEQHHRSAVSTTAPTQQQQQQQASLLTSRAQSYDRVYPRSSEHCYPILNLPQTTEPWPPGLSVNSSQPTL